MLRILGVFLVVAVYSFSFAGGFYKWKDENGKVHITDYLPDGVEVISGGKSMSVNRISGPNIQSGSSQGGGYASSEAQVPAQTQNHELEAEIIEAKNKYDTCMRNVKGDFSNDLNKNFEIVVKRKECQRYMDIYENLLYSKYGAQTKSSSSKSGSNSPSPMSVASPPPQNILPPPQHLDVKPHGGATDQYGTYYAPSGAGNMINTKTGSPVVPQGGDTYLDTQTGRIMHGN